MSKLWYENEAKEWEEALPLGNGRLGAMLYGGVYHEEIQVNEESMWYGGPVDRINPDAKENLGKIRELILNGRIPEAERLMKYALSGCPEGMHPYQTLGNIYIDFEGIGAFMDYKRELDLDTAIQKTFFRDDDTVYTRSAFISKPADVMILHIKAEGRKKLNFDVHMRRDKFFDGVNKLGDNGITLYGNLGKGGFDFSLGLTAKAKDGKVRVIGEHIVVSEASEVLLYFCADTSYHVETEVTGDVERSIYHRIVEAEGRKLSELRSEHVDDYRNLFSRMDFSLTLKDDYDAIPTDVRIKNAAQKKGADLGLGKLYFDYGRYLLISCSREGGLPATLQGIWNKDMTPPWDSKYTVNINLQMNYWPAEICNLSECHEPLFSLIEKVAENGRKTAQKMYGCRGWVCHHNTDIWGDTAPQDLWIPGTYWVMGGAWLCTHLWTHYQYTMDEEFLKKYFPIMRECAEFYLDFLIERNGYLVTCPSVSPENTFIMPDGTMGANSYGVTMDNQILRSLFSECIKAAEILGVDDDLNTNIKDAMSKLIPTRIGSNGAIMEWAAEFEEVEPGHRHISHLYGLYPSDEISCDKTPELARAARLTLENRLSQGGGHTGWSRAWIMNHYARLWDGEEAFNNLQKLFANSTYLNLFDRHPPFQIDGNFGVTAAIAGMCVQSYEDRIILLPAIPKAWKEGHMNGLKLMGNGTMNIAWRNSKLSECQITFDKDISIVLRYKNENLSVDFEKGVTKTFTANMLSKIKEV